MEAALNASVCREMALVRSSGGASSGSNAARAGWSKLNNVPEVNASTITIHNRTAPVAVRAASVKADSMSSVWVRKRRRLLSCRSANVPPSGAKKKNAEACASDTVPNARAEFPVIRSTKRLWATICIQVPRADASTPIHNVR